MGEGVTEGAVGEEEIVDAGLGENVAEFGGRSAGCGGGSRSGGWAELAPKFKALEEGSPGGVNGGGIGFPSFVEFLEKRGVSRMADPTQGWRRRGGGAVWI